MFAVFYYDARASKQDWVTFTDETKAKSFAEKVQGAVVEL